MTSVFKYENDSYDRYYVRFWNVNAGFLIFWAFAILIAAISTTWLVGLLLTIIPLLSFKGLLKSARFLIKDINIKEDQVQLCYFEKSKLNEKTCNLSDLKVSINYPWGSTKMTIIGQPKIVFEVLNEFKIEQANFQDHFKNWDFESLKNVFTHIKLLKSEELSKKEERIIDRLETDGYVAASH